MRELLSAQAMPDELRGLAALFLACGKGLVDDLRSLGYLIDKATPARLAAICPELSYDKQTGCFELDEPLPSRLDEDFVTALLVLEHDGENHELSDQERAFERFSSLAAMLLEQGENGRCLGLLHLTGQLLSMPQHGSASAKEDDSEQQFSFAIGKQSRDGKGEFAESSQALIPQMRVRLLGDLEVELNGQLLRHCPLSKGLVRTAFMLLVLNQGKGIARDTLLEYLWPERDGERALVSFYNLWHRLTLSIQLPDGSCPYLSNEAQLLRVDPRHVTSDIAEFERLARTVLFEQGDFEERLAAIDRLEQLYRHDIILLKPSHPNIAAARERYRSMFTDILLVASRMHLEQDQNAMALWYARRAHDADPNREDVYRALMSTQEASGQRTSALSTYFDCKRYLADELGLSPSQQTTALYQELILDGS